MKKNISAFIALLLPMLVSAQFVLTGTVRDSETGSPLSGATITIQDLSAHAISDANGKYHIAIVKSGNYQILCSYIGYRTVSLQLYLPTQGTVNFDLTPNNIFTEEVTVRATRASSNSPTAFMNLNRKEIDKNNSGRGFEYLLEQTPSAVVSSNAGAGIGYTSIRIRGSDASRINVTLNGIPMNDPEDQGAYFVDLPDLASSVDNIQVQRGVGTSTNGAGAFGASINIQTTTRRDSAYAEINSSAGSYRTIKNTLNVGSGLLGGHFTLDGRLSRMSSDGYIDRAFSHFKSFFLSGAYYGKNSVLRANVFSGYEQTYQAWDGVPQDSIKAGNYRYNELGYINSSKSYYKNQTDNFVQDYYQLLYDRRLGQKLSFSGALHYTRGYGYYEEYKNSVAVTDYGLEPVVIGSDTISNTDLVRRLWQHTDFYGLTYNFNYKPSDRLDLIWGGAYNEYKGTHSSNIEWTQQSTSILPDYEYSSNKAKKNDFNTFARADYRLHNLLFYGDIQYRHIYYSFLGYDRNLNNVQQQVTLNFFNPKAGITYQFNYHSNVYISLAVGNHEPNRNDFINSSPISRPKAENLKDFEAGYRVTKSIFSAGINVFYMLYSNQLVLTGSLNDVGEAIRTNIKDSYRTGIELNGRVKIGQQLNWDANITFSTNKIKDFNQVLFDNNLNPVVTNYHRTDIAYSPNVTGSSIINYEPIKNGEIALVSKYVSRQYLDNTATNSRSLNGYFVNDLRLNYHFSSLTVKHIGLGLLINNIFSTRYHSDGVTYIAIENGKIANNNYFFPQAPRNFIISIDLKF